jgi:hypothetical protein
VNGLGEEDTVYYGARNNLPRLMVTCHQNVWYFHDGIKDAAKKELTWHQGCSQERINRKRVWQLDKAPEQTHGWYW